MKIAYLAISVVRYREMLSWLAMMSFAPSSHMIP